MPFLPPSHDPRHCAVDIRPGRTGRPRSTNPNVPIASGSVHYALPRQNSGVEIVYSHRRLPGAPPRRESTFCMRTTTRCFAAQTAPPRLRVSMSSSPLLSSLPASARVHVVLAAVVLSGRGRSRVETVRSRSPREQRDSMHLARPVRGIGTCVYTSKHGGDQIFG